jgi:hypothetical protein
MIIDIRKNPATYINLDRHIEKNNSMEELIKDFRFRDIKRFSGIDRPDSSIIGCASSHFEILSTVSGIHTILEDDCELQKYAPIIDIPDRTDAIYLGLSSWAFNGNSGTEWVHKFEDVPGHKNLFKVENMLATHAITYISKRYTDACIDVAKNCMKNEIHVDCGFAEIQKDFNVYALVNPIFYQSSNTPYTKISFDTIRRNNVKA